MIRVARAGMINSSCGRMGLCLRWGKEGAREGGREGGREREPARLIAGWRGGVMIRLARAGMINSSCGRMGLCLSWGKEGGREGGREEEDYL